MNKKIISIISGIAVILAGIVTLNINKEDSYENSYIENTNSSDIITDELVTEFPTESITESPTEIIIESVIETITEPVTEIITESITEPLTEIFYEETTEIFTDDNNYIEYHFRNQKLLNQHFEKHGGEFSEFNYITAQDYEKGASDVINNPNALFKTEAEDGDGVYYIEQSNEFVVLSTDGYIRTYFRPTRGIEYFNRQ